MPETLTWIDPDGTSYALTDLPTIGPLAGRQGAFMPPARFVEEMVPLQPGARLRRVDFGVREVDLPIRIQAASETALRTALRAWLLRFDPSRGDGRLRVTAPDGSVRELTCRYAGGLDGQEGGGAGPFWWECVVTLRAVDPYWYATAPIVDAYTLSTPATFFPFFPLRLSSSTIFADTTVTNGGDVEAWPVWTVTGPGSDLVLRNLTTGKLLSLSGVTLSGGETITIDTRPRAKSVVQNNGTSLYDQLANGSALWPLPRGSNSVRIELSSATADSQVVLSYYPRYLGC